PLVLQLARRPGPAGEAEAGRAALEGLAGGSRTYSYGAGAHPFRFPVQRAPNAQRIGHPLLGANSYGRFWWDRSFAASFAAMTTVARVVGYLPHARGSDPPRRPAPIDGDWMGVSSVLAGEPRHPRSSVAHYRLESRISTLPEVHEATVVLARLGAVAAAFVKLPQ